MRNSGTRCKIVAIELFCLSLLAFLIFGIISVWNYIKGPGDLQALLINIGIMLLGFVLSWFVFVIVHTIGDIAENAKYIANYCRRHDIHIEKKASGYNKE